MKINKNLHHHIEDNNLKIEIYHVLENEAEISKDERRAFGHIIDKNLHVLTGHQQNCHCDHCIEEDCEYCGKEIESCKCDFLGKEYKRGLYHIENLDCVQCAALMEGKIRKIPSVFFASVSFNKKELRLISKNNPDLLIPEITKISRTFNENINILPPKQNTKLNTELYVIPTLNCPSCAIKLEKNINQQQGVFSATVTFSTKQLKITAENPDKLLPEIINACNKIEPGTKIVKKINYNKNEQNKSKSHKYSKFINSTGFFLYIIGLSGFYDLIKFSDLLTSSLLIISYFLLGHDILMKAIKNIINKNVFNEYLLMSIATLGALAISEYPEATGVILFYKIGEYLEHFAIEKSRKQITETIDLRPETVHKLKNGIIETITPEDVDIGDIIRILPGERVPLDGIISKGKTQIDTSLLTGESIPRSVTIGDSVYSGTINLSSTIELQVEKTLSESMVSRILDSIENALAGKPSIDKFITKFSRIYTPIVVFAAIFLIIFLPFFTTNSYKDALYIALTFLVISCPCALVISVPLSFFSGLGVASKHGILFKSGNIIEILNKTNVILLDKTGTLTEGSFKIREIETYQNINEDKLLALVAGAEAHSTHPIAKSIIQAAEHKKLYIPKFSTINEISGKGIITKLGNKDIIIGNKKLLNENGITIDNNNYSNDFETIIYVAINKKLLGKIKISDALKKDSFNGLQKLTKKNIDIIMLTGDNDTVAENIAKKLNIKKFYSELLPLDKIKILKKYTTNNSKTLFVGDGINDAPVLATADIGAAMGSGSDAAIEASDIVFLNNNVSAISTSISIAEKTITTTKINIFIAIFIKIAVMILGLIGMADMWIAVFADTGVTLLCILLSMNLFLRKFE